MSELNGHLNGYDRGGQGDSATPPLEHGRGETMRLMQRMVGLGHSMLDEQIQKIIETAVAVRDHPQASTRDRLRAGELIKSLIDRGIDVAMYLDKNNRMDDGKPTEIVDNRILRLEFDSADGVEIE